MILKKSWGQGGAGPPGSACGRSLHRKWSALRSSRKENRKEQTQTSQTAVKRKCGLHERSLCTRCVKLEKFVALSWIRTEAWFKAHFYQTGQQTRISNCLTRQSEKFTFRQECCHRLTSMKYNIESSSQVVRCKATEEKVPTHVLLWKPAEPQCGFQCLWPRMWDVGFTLLSCGCIRNGHISGARFNKRRRGFVCKQWSQTLWRL